jgi:Copper type II ascorbate-dependent monooxygenase, C-terminal domain
MMKRWCLVLGVGLMSACSSENGDGAATGDTGTGAGAAHTPTFYEDVAPIFSEKCVQCHQDGGIAPFSLNDYEAARERSLQIAAFTADRIMPPFLVETGGACGSFDESAALDDAQIALIGEWARGGAAEGTPVALTVPPLPSLKDGTDFSTPEFLPQITGGELAQFDEYRCFAVPTNLSADAFVTGYDVSPGNPKLVHHLLGFVVDPNRVVGNGQTNAQVMEQLHASDPNPSRDGWSCYGMAGQDVDVESAPVTWGPGQGVVDYPGGLGVSLKRDRVLVIQIHYNLADAAVPTADSTTVRLRLEAKVERQAVFVFQDDLLGSLYRGQPTTLEPGQPSVKFTWEHSGGEIGLPPGVPTEIVGLLPHMHGRGHKFTFEVNNTGDFACQGQVNAWNFNWQRAYNYAKPIPFDADSRVRVTCDYDTSSDTQPVLPGWGTRNEMCLAVMMVALPRGIMF